MRAAPLNTLLRHSSIPAKHVLDLKVQAFCQAVVASSTSSPYVTPTDPHTTPCRMHPPLLGNCVLQAATPAAPEKNLCCCMSGNKLSTAVSSCMPHLTKPTLHHHTSAQLLPPPQSVCNGCCPATISCKPTHNSQRCRVPPCLPACLLAQGSCLGAAAGRLLLLLPLLALAHALRPCRLVLAHGQPVKCVAGLALLCCPAARGDLLGAHLTRQGCSRVGEHLRTDSSTGQQVHRYTPAAAAAPAQATVKGQGPGRYMRAVALCNQVQPGTRPS